MDGQKENRADILDWKKRKMQRFEDDRDRDSAGTTRDKYCFEAQ